MEKITAGKRSIAAAAVVLILAGALIGKTVFDSSGAGTPVQAQVIDAEELALPDIIERVIPAVVNIKSKRVVRNSLSSDPLFRDFFRRFFRDMPRERVQRNLGSGVIVSSDGYILTSNHLVEKAEEIEVILPDRREFDAEIIGTDNQSDVAVIKIEGDDLPVLPTGDSDRLRLGETVIAIGYPFGVGQTVTRGIVSALGKTLELVNYEDFIQTDAAINPGNSGGALINIDGELIGINTAIVSRSGGSQGIGFAIPINLATSIMESIIDHGYVVRGYLGVMLQDVTQGMARVFGMEGNRGALISEVMDDTPADRAGIRSGDVIVSFNGKRVDDTNDLKSMVAGVTPGRKAEVELIRDGEKKTVEVEIGEMPDRGRELREDSDEGSSLFVGVGLRNLNDYLRNRLNIPDEVRGVVVTELSRSSAAAEAGIKEGDVIVEVNREKVENVDDMREIVEELDSDTAVVRIFRDDHYYYLEIEE
jgi:serine protease Do